jgi:MEMO1 family protein
MADNQKIRKPAVAGRFYPSDKERLKELIQEIYEQEKPHINKSLASKSFHGAVVPHAGYVYSAYQAIHFFELLKLTDKVIDTFVIINPNHTGYGERIALDNHSAWETPLGSINQDMEFIHQLGFPFSNIAHDHEHSGEVMLPLLHFFVPYDFKIAMITLSQQTPQNAVLLAEKIKHTADSLNRRIAIIASSDFCHFKNAETGYELDELVVEQIRNQDIEKLYHQVKEFDISVCGYGPIMCLMAYAGLHGEYCSDIMARGHSGQVLPSQKVVDYISILFYKK